MPDANKLKAMAAAGYQVVKCCATCRWREGLGAQQERWGHCAHPEATYRHKKHSQTRQLPAHALLCCGRHEWSEEATAQDRVSAGAQRLGVYATEPWKDEDGDQS